MLYLPEVDQFAGVSSQGGRTDCQYGGMEIDL